MGERATVFQVINWGVESVFGTPPANFKRLASIGIDTGVKANVVPFRPIGQKFLTMAAEGKEWVEGKLNVDPNYSELIYPLSSLLTTVTPVLSGSLTETWTFTPNTTSADTPKSMTIEQGSTERAHKYSGAMVNDLAFNFTRDDVSASGSLLGQLLNDGITMTSGGSVTSIVDQQPILPNQGNLYLQDTYAALPGTALTRFLSGSFEIGNRFNPVWPIDASQTSYAAYVEAVPTAKAKIKLEADAAGMGLLATLRAGATKFMRIGYKGAQIESGKYYGLTIDAALKCTGVNPFSDENGIYAIEWDFDVAFDSTWGNAFQVVVVNKLATL